MKPILIFLFTCNLAWTANYRPGPDAQRQPGVPKGRVIQGEWKNCQHFPGTVRTYWVYIPAQYDANTPGNLMVFQDGGGFVRENGHARVPIVFDNLIHKKELPVTIGLFVNPGSVPPAEPGNQPRRNRAFEYDTVSADYANFIIEELWPAVANSII